MPAVTYRPATLDDAELVSELMTAANPEMVHNPQVLRYRWEHPRTGYASGRFIAERAGEPIAYVGWYHGPWTDIPDRRCEVEAWIVREAVDRDLAVSVLSWTCDLAVAEGSWLLFAYCGEDEPDMLAALAALGFERVRAERVWELDLRAHGSRIEAEAAAARRDMAERGIELTTLAAWRDGDRLRRVYELDVRTRPDIPSTLPVVVETFADFERRINSPERRLDRTWIALAEGRPVALSYLTFPPGEGTVWTGYTCSHPEYRGRGIARAVKLQTLAQAAALGVPAVRTDNDLENAPMLRINERLGYVPRPGFVEHHKRVRLSENA